MRGLLEIDGNSWHAKLFFWSLRVWSKFKYEYEFEQQQQINKWKKQTNICFYIRTITVWMPFVFICHIFTLAAVIYAAFVLPSRLFGWGYGMFWLYLLAVVTAIVGVTIGVDYFIPKMRGYFDERKYKSRSSTVKAKVPIKKKGLSGVEVAALWVKARKESICPLITFKNEVSE